MNGAIVLALLIPASTLADTWEYRTSTDRMTSKETKFASIVSDSSLDLKFPYGGPNFGAITIRERGGSTDVMVRVQKGQIPCHGFSGGCTVLVRFDTAPPTKFSAVGPDDSSTETVFLHDTGRFINGAKKARKILVQFTMFQAGTQTLEFSPPTPLDWGKTPSKAK